MSDPIPEFARTERVPKFRFVTDKPQIWAFPDGTEWAFESAELTDTTLILHKRHGPEKFVLEQWRKHVGRESGEVELVFIQLVTGERAALKRSFLENVFGKTIPEHRLDEL